MVSTGRHYLEKLLWDLCRWKHLRAGSTNICVGGVERADPVWSKGQSTGDFLKALPAPCLYEPVQLAPV